MKVRKQPVREREEHVEEAWQIASERDEILSQQDSKWVKRTETRWERKQQGSLGESYVTDDFSMQPES